MDGANALMELVRKRYSTNEYHKEHWEGSFDEYLAIVKANPRVTRNAFQRVYDMIMSYGTETIHHHRERTTHYKFFDDPDNDGADAVFGLERPLAELVNAFMSAAKGYGIEKRVLLLHGPVGSSKSTIARLLIGAWSAIHEPTPARCTRSVGSKTAIPRVTRPVPCMKNRSSSFHLNVGRKCAGCFLRLITRFEFSATSIHSADACTTIGCANTAATGLG